MQVLGKKVSTTLQLFVLILDMYNACKVRANENPLNTKKVIKDVTKCGLFFDVIEGNNDSANITLPIKKINSVITIENYPLKCFQGRVHELFPLLL